MSRARRRIVLYFPLHNDPARGVEAGKDLLPLSVLTIAGLPAREGYEVVVIDGNLYSQQEAHRRVVEACDGALVYGTTGILGYQVADAFLCTQAVKAAHPRLPAVSGGWFASCAPEMQLATGLYDAVAIGQGELTFLDLVHAFESGAELEEVAGLALLRDGQVVRTAHRSVVGWEQLVECPWSLVDFEPYRTAQLSGRPQTDRMPTPPGFHGRPFVGISYFSSFGCPEPCTFCCSPQISGLRWKALPAARMVDDLADLKQRWNFDTVRFHDANWGLNERRIREFCDGVLARGVKFHYFAMMQARSILRFDATTLDAMRSSGMYVVGIGGETGDEETLRAIGKHTSPGENVRAAIEVDRRGIASWVTYIVGYPNESAASMRNTLEECRQIAVQTRQARPAAWPFHPIPGNALYAAALELGFRAPTSLLEWGRFGQYHLDLTWPGKIPDDVARERKLFEHYFSLSLGLARGRSGWWERRARRRLEDGTYRRALFEARAFDVWNRVSRAVRGDNAREIFPGYQTSVELART